MNLKQIYIGKVFHKRFEPKVHEFTYAAFFIQFSIKNISHLENLFFSVNRFNFFSFQLKDHGYRDGSDLFIYAEDILKKNAISTPIDDIVIQTLPRVLGFVFNPVSFWYLYDKNRQAIATLAEVNNTFGETHTYLLPPNVFTEKKLMQVSPFNQITGNYQFFFKNDQDHELVGINYFKNNQLSLTATVEGKKSEWSNSGFFKLFFLFPLNTFVIVFRIHYQALILYIKGIPFFGKNGVIHD